MYWRSIISGLARRFNCESGQLMTGKPTSIIEYIDAAPAQAQPHLKQLYAILKSVAPQAQEAIKWGNPFFIEPRFLFAFSAHKAHMSFAPTAESLAYFSEALKAHKTTRHFLKVPYTETLPEALIRQIAEYCVSAVAKRDDDAFWPRENF